MLRLVVKPMEVAVISEVFFEFWEIRNEHLFQTEDQFCISVIYELSTFYIDFELH